jgi:hypothetical protein
LKIPETVLQSTVTDSEPIQKKSFIETMKASMIAVVKYIVSMILKPFQMIQNIFASKVKEAPAEIKTVKAAVAKVATAVVAKVVKPVPSAGDIAAKKYALEKLKEIDQGTSIFDTIDASIVTEFLFKMIMFQTSDAVMSITTTSYFPCPFSSAMRDTAAKRAAENPGMWPPVVLPPVMPPRPKRSVSDLTDDELKGKRYAKLKINSFTI